MHLSSQIFLFLLSDAIVLDLFQEINVAIALSTSILELLFETLEKHIGAL